MELFKKVFRPQLQKNNIFRHRFSAQATDKRNKEEADATKAKELDQTSTSTEKR